jgi:hypothetical protein
MSKIDLEGKLKVDIKVVTGKNCIYCGKGIGGELTGAKRTAFGHTFDEHLEYEIWNELYETCCSLACACNHIKQEVRIDKLTKEMIIKYFGEEIVTYLYFIKMSMTDIIKIGISKNIEKRLSGIQTGNPYELEVLNKFKCSNSGLEKLVHKLYKLNRIKGEWFSLDAESIEEIKMLTEDKLIHKLVMKKL